MGERVTLKNVRLSFPQLHVAKAVNDEGRPAFSAAFLMTPDDPQVDEINAAIDKAAIEKWGPKTKTILGALRGTDKVCLHNGDSKAQYDGYEGNYFINARSYTKIPVVDRDRSPLSEQDGKPYGGCYVDASIEIWVQDSRKWGKRVNATLRWVQFRRDGDAFSASPPANPDEIPDISEEEDDDDVEDLV